MKCPFCQIQLKIEGAPPETQYVQGVCNCGDCITYFNLGVAGDTIQSLGIWGTHRGEKYAVFFRYAEPFLTRENDKFVLSGPKGTILRFDFYPNITPQNFQQKLSTYLPFL